MIFSKLCRLTRGPAVGLAVMVGVVTVLGSGTVTIGDALSGAASEISVGGSTDPNPNRMEQCIDQRIADGDADLQPGVESVTRNEAESLCAH